MNLMALRSNNLKQKTDYAVGRHVDLFFIEFWAIDITKGAEITLLANIAENKNKYQVSISSSFLYTYVLH